MHSSSRTLASSFVHPAHSISVFPEQRRTVKFCPDDPQVV
jgi:hypothetical protein